MKTNCREILSKHIHVGWDQEQRIVQAMKEYTRSVIDAILEDEDLIYTDGIAMETGEAMYNYSKFSDLKKNLV